MHLLKSLLEKALSLYSANYDKWRMISSGGQFDSVYTWLQDGEQDVGSVSVLRFEGGQWGKAEFRKTQKGIELFFFGAREREEFFDFLNQLYANHNVVVRPKGLRMVPRPEQAPLFRPVPQDPDFPPVA